MKDNYISIILPINNINKNIIAYRNKINLHHMVFHHIYL